MTARIYCPDCNTPGQSDEYKGDNVIQCPECQKILFRDIKA